MTRRYDPAFPCPGDNAASGMTHREHVAVLMMAALLTGRLAGEVGYCAACGSSITNGLPVLARLAVDAAEALILEMNGREEAERESRRLAPDLVVSDDDDAG